ncbi:MAG TPA: S8 family serine peptidase [Chryseosolibacter sp.]|nr:S8 family serine peptidase [Chryseosolibacter sp.]
MAMFRRMLGMGVSLLILIAGPISAQHNQKIRVKLSENAAARIEQKVRKDANGRIRTDVAALDVINNRSGAKEMRRVFPYAGKYEERHRRHGLHLWYEIGFDNANLSLNGLVKDYQQLAEVEIAEQILEKKLIEAIPGDQAVLSVNDPQISSQWHYDNTGQSGGTAGADISLFHAWNIESGDDNVIVAIIDGGVETTHVDLQENMWVNQTESAGTPGYDDDGNGYVDDIHGYNFAYGSGEIESHYHGVHVAGTVAAVNNNGIGVSGVAGGSGTGDGARLMTCQVFAEYGVGGFDVSFVYAADNGAVIAQNSWGYTEPGVYEQSVLDAIDYFIANAGYDQNGNPIGPMQGGIVIFAAGNSSSSDLYYPGYYDKVLAVAATDHNDQIAYFSNYGTWVDIAAPGNNVFSTYPGNSYEYLSGTSMACPHVSGVAALIVSHYPGITPDGVRQRLTHFADNIDAENPSYVGMFGAGRLNAFNALYEEDSIPPAAIEDLSFADVSFDKATLRWTATGASNNEGVASGYIIKFSNSPIDENNFDSANTYSHGFSPQAAGDEEELTVSGLAQSTPYYFAIKAFDYSNNISPISNTIAFTTTAPPAIDVDPDTLVHHMFSGKQDTVFLSVTNTGEGILEFSTSLSNFDSAEPLTLTSTSSGAYSVFTDPDSKTQREVLIKPFSYSGPSLEGVTIGMALYSYDGYQYFADQLTERGAQIVQLSSLDTANLQDIQILFLDDQNLSISDQDILNIRNFVGAGNSIFILGDDMYSQYAINEILSGTGISCNSVDYYDALIDDIFEHPTTVGVSNIYSSAYGMFYTAVDTSVVLMNDDLNRPHAVATRFEQGKILAFANEIAADPLSGDNNLFLHQVIDWLSDINQWVTLPEQTFSAPSGATVEVPIYLNSNDLVTGQYVSSIFVESNDPLVPELSVPLTVSVTGSSSIILEGDSVDFGEVFISAQANRSLVIGNDGTDTLRLTIDIGTDSVFIASFDSLLIAPGSEQIVDFTFAPQEDSLYQKIVTLYSNDPQDSVLLVTFSGEGAYPPIIGYAPDSLYHALPTGNIDTLYVEISNSGGADLSASITLTQDDFTSPSVNGVVQGINAKINPNSVVLSRPSFPASGPRKAEGAVAGSKGLASSSGRHVAVLGAEPPDNLQDVVEKLYKTGKFSSVSYIDVSAYTPTLDEVEVFDAVLIFNNYPYADNETLGNVLADYFDNGGGVVSAMFEVSGYDEYKLSGRWYADQYYVIDEGIFTSGQKEYLGHYENSPIMDDVNSFNGGDQSYRPTGTTFVDGAELVASWTDGSPLVVTRTIDGKSRVDLGMFPVSGDRYYGMWDPSTDGALLMANALMYTMGINSSWLAVGTPGITVPTGTSVNVPVIFNSVGKAAGTYTGSVVVSSNDPANEVVTIPVTFTVTPSPDIEVNPSSIVYDTLFADIEESSIDIAIRNDGSDTLTVNLDFANSANFSSDQAAFEIQPFSQVSVPVVFAPTSEGVFDETLRLVTNDPKDPEIEVSLHGVAVLAPAMSIIPDSLQVTVDAGNIVNQDITVSNLAGLSTLTWNASVLYNPQQMAVVSKDQTLSKNKPALHALQNYLKEQKDSNEPLADTTDGYYWLNLGQNAGSISSGATMNVQSAFDATYLLDGVYRADIHFEGNDPFNNHQVVPVWLNVIGQPEIVLSQNEITFDPIFVGLADSTFVFISNEGTKALELEASVSGAGANYISWLSDSVILPGGWAVLQVIFAPSAAGSITGEIVISSNDQTDPIVTVPLLGIGLAAPIAVISPSELSLVVLTESTQTAQFTVSNNGEGDLEITIPDFIQMSSHTPSDAGDDGEFGFGYKWIDSNEPNGAVFDWIDISSTGTDIYLSDDDYQSAYLPFYFPYFDVSEDIVYISSNGYISFNEQGASSTSPDLISGYSPSNVISALGRDLYPNYDSRIIYHGNSDRFIVTYLNIPNYSGYGSHTFQIILYPSGKIKYQYLQTTGDSYGEIGIDDADGWRGLIIPNYGDYIQNNLAIEISSSPSFVTDITPSTITILPGATQSFDVTVDALDLDTGRYEQVVNILTNDPQQPIIPYNITMNVVTGLEFTAALSDTVIVDEGGELAFQFAATNPRAVNLAFALDESLVNATISEDGFFEFNPGYDQSGTHEVTVTVTDGVLGSAQKFWLTVSNVNRRPVVVNAISTVETTVESVININGNDVFTDYDNEGLSFQIISDDSTLATVRMLEGGEAEVKAIAQGIVPITMTATDNHGASATEVFVLIIDGFDDVPELVTAFDDVAVYLGDENLRMPNAVHFSDDDLLTFTTHTSDPDVAQASIDHDSLYLQLLTAGETIVTVVATDPGGRTVSTSFTLTVMQRITDAEEGKYSRVLTVHPNPSKGDIIIEYYARTTSNHLIELLDVNGRVIDVIFLGETNPGGYELTYRPQHKLQGLYLIRHISSFGSEIRKVTFE